MVAPTRSFAFDRAGSIELEQRLERGSLGASQWDAGVVTASFLDMHADLIAEQIRAAELAAAGEATSVGGAQPAESASTAAASLPLAGLRAVELGAGLGLNTIVAGRLGAEAVVSTDGDDSVMDLLEINVESNGPVVQQATRVMTYRWGEESETAAVLGALGGARPSLILASDLIYPGNTDARAPLLESMRALSRPDGTTTAIYGHTRRESARGDLAAFLWQARAMGFCVRRVPKRLLPAVEGAASEGASVYTMRLRPV